MSGRADLRRGKVECDLDRDDQADVCEPLFRQWRMMMSEQKSSPRTDHPHDAARSPNDLADLNQADPGQNDYPCAGGDPRNQIAGDKSDRADRVLEWRTEHVKREKVKREMQKSAMEEERSEQAPVFMLCKNY